MPTKRIDTPFTKPFSQRKLINITENMWCIDLKRLINIGKESNICDIFRLIISNFGTVAGVWYT